jgi:hypothetical protein
MMAVGLWSCMDIDGIEASLYRKIMSIGNDIPNKVILNTITISRLGADFIFFHSREPQDHYRIQDRMMKYFEKIEDRKLVKHNSGNESNEVTMDGT